MAETAFSVVYRDEWIAGFERDTAKLRDAVTTEAMVTGRQGVFLVADSNREAVTRGANGLIPASADNLDQKTVTLAEAHDLSQKTNFNIFAGQSNQRAILQQMGRKVINRDVDNKILAALASSTINVNASASLMTKKLVNDAITTLGEADVPTDDGMLYAAVTHAAWAALEDIPAFASADYVDDRPLMEGRPAGMRWRLWNGVRWTVHNGLSGAGTSSAECHIWHKNSCGHAYASEDIQALAGYDEEQDYSWARTSLYHGALLLQNTGVVTILHDDTA